MARYYVVTGAAGFIGSNIVAGLNAQGFDNIIAVDNLDYTAEATQTYHFDGTAMNVPELLKLIYGI